MPNWCSTFLEIETGNERLAEQVSDKIASWCHECGVENGFGDSWLGNVAVKSNEFSKYSDVSCRGTLEDVYAKGTKVHCVVESAWTPQLGAIVCGVNHAFPEKTFEYYYDAEEPGCCFYCTNRRELVDQYHVDTCGIENETLLEQIGGGQYDADRKWLTGILQKFYRSHESLEILIDRVENEEGGCITRWEFEPIGSYIE